MILDTWHSTIRKIQGQGAWKELPAIDLMLQENERKHHLQSHHDLHSCQQGQQGRGHQGHQERREDQKLQSHHDRPIWGWKGRREDQNFKSMGGNPLFMSMLKWNRRLPSITGCQQPLQVTYLRTSGTIASRSTFCTRRTLWAKKGGGREWLRGRAKPAASCSYTQKNFQTFPMKYTMKITSIYFIRIYECMKSPYSVKWLVCPIQYCLPGNVSPVSQV